MLLSLKNFSFGLSIAWYGVFVGTISLFIVNSWLHICQFFAKQAESLCNAGTMNMINLYVEFVMLSSNLSHSGLHTKLLENITR